jgi:hypothetical protein
MRTAFPVVSETLKKLVDDTLGAEFSFDFSLMFKEIKSYQGSVIHLIDAQFFRAPASAQNSI